MILALIATSIKMVLQSQKSAKCRDPFAVDPLPKAHYHPSKQKQLTLEQRKTAISQKKSGQELKSKGDLEGTATSLADEMFLRGGNFCSTKFLGKDNDEDSYKFDETWPSTERPSFISSTGEEDQSPLSINKLLQDHDQQSRFSDLKQNLKFMDRNEPASQKQQKHQIKSECSTLQRYIERFRKGEPMSREERQRKCESSSKDFWWMADHSSPPSDTSTPREDSKDVGKPFSSYFHQTPDKDTPSPMDERTRRLQERADKLLERSISTVASSDPVVSTDGLGSSPGVTMSSFDEPPYRPTFTRDLDRNSIPKFQLDMPFSEKYSTPGRPTVTLPHGPKSSRPEDDILHQWRVRRRLEEARSAADKKSSKTNRFGFLTKPKDRAWTNRTEEYEPETKPSYTPLASPILNSNSKQTDIDPHLHLMCDLLPCPHQQEYRIILKNQEKERSIETHYKYLQAERPDVEKQTAKIKPENKDISAIESENQTLMDHKIQKNQDSIPPKRQTEYSGTPAKSKSEDTTSQKSFYEDSTSKQKSVSIQENSGSGNSMGEVVTGKLSMIADKGKEVKILKPRICTSPSAENQKQPVENVIGQVVKNRLFTASTSTVISSIDSVSSVTTPQPHTYVSTTEWPSLSDQHNSEQSNGCHIQPSPTQSFSKEKLESEYTDETYKSDGEYSEDQLLQMLRQQRCQYEKQLQHIDNLLAGIQDRERGDE